MKKILLLLLIGITLLPALFGENIKIQMKSTGPGFYRRNIGEVDFRMSDYWKPKLKFSSEIKDVTIGTLAYKENLYHILHGVKSGKNILIFDSNMNYNFSDDTNQWLTDEPTFGISEKIGVENVDYLRLLVGLNEPIDEYLLLEGINAISLSAYDVTCMKGSFTLYDDYVYDVVLGKKENTTEFVPENLLIGIDKNFNQSFELEELFESDENIVIDGTYYSISEFVLESSTLILEEVSQKSVEIEKEYPIKLGDNVVLEEYFGEDKNSKIVFISYLKNPWSQQWFENFYEIKNTYGIDFYFFVPDFECKSCDDRFMKSLDSVETLNEEDFINLIDDNNFDLIHLLLLNEKNEVVYTSSAVLNASGLTWETVYDFISFDELNWLIEHIL